MDSDTGEIKYKSNAEKERVFFLLLLNLVCVVVIIWIVKKTGFIYSLHATSARDCWALNNIVWDTSLYILSMFQLANLSEGMRISFFKELITLGCLAYLVAKE